MTKILCGPTAIIDPPWAYEQASKHERLTGYTTISDPDSDKHQYNSLSTDDLAKLEIGKLNLRYCFLWTTGPFIEDAYRLIRAWGLEPITMLAWVKCLDIETNGLPAFAEPFDKKHPEKVRRYWPHDPSVIIKPTYGVGYWFRGCVEPIILAKAPDAPSIRTPWVGLLSPNARHSRKPDTLHQLIETNFPGPYVELFGRRSRPGWSVLGNEAPGYEGEDMRASIQKFLDIKEQTPHMANVETA